MNDRIKQLRTALNLTQDEFGKQIGSARNTIANYENGNRNPSNTVIIAICREFNVNEEWLRTGTGEMFQPQNDDLDYMIARYGNDLTKAEKAIVLAMLRMDNEQRAVFDRFLDDFVALRNK